MSGLVTECRTSGSQSSILGRASFVPCVLENDLYSNPLNQGAYGDQCKQGRYPASFCRHNKRRPVELEEWLGYLTILMSRLLYSIIAALVAPKIRTVPTRTGGRIKRVIESCYVYHPRSRLRPPVPGISVKSQPNFLSGSNIQSVPKKT